MAEVEDKNQRKEEEEDVSEENEKKRDSPKEDDSSARSVAGLAKRCRETHDYTPLKDFFPSDFHTRFKVAAAAVLDHDLGDDHYLPLFIDSLSAEFIGPGSMVQMFTSKVCLLDFSLAEEVLKPLGDPIVIQVLHNFIAKHRDRFGDPTSWDVWGQVPEPQRSEAKGNLLKWFQAIEHRPIKAASPYHHLEIDYLADNPWRFEFDKKSRFSPPFNVTWADVEQRLRDHGQEHLLAHLSSAAVIKEFRASHAHYGTQKYLRALVVDDTAGGQSENKGQSVLVMLQNNGYFGVDVEGKAYTIKEVMESSDPSPAMRVARCCYVALTCSDDERKKEKEPAAGGVPDEHRLKTLGDSPALEDGEGQQTPVSAQPPSMSTTADMKSKETQKEKQKGEQAEKRNEEFQVECVICMEEKPQVVLVPCGHLVMCQTCAETAKDCPTCRGAIEKRQRVFQ